MIEDQATQNKLEMIQQTFEEIWVKGNLDLLDLSMDPNIIRHSPPFPDVHGLAAYKEHIRTIRSAMSNIQIRLEDVIFQGDLSSARVALSFVHTGKMQGLQVPPTGRQAKLLMGVFSHWKGDKIVEEWAFIDYLGFLQQIGVIPSRTAA